MERSVSKDSRQETQPGGGIINGPAKPTSWTPGELSNKVSVMKDAEVKGGLCWPSKKIVTGLVRQKKGEEVRRNKDPYFRRVPTLQIWMQFFPVCTFPRTCSAVGDEAFPMATYCSKSAFSTSVKTLSSRHHAREFILPPVLIR